LGKRVYLILKQVSGWSLAYLVVLSVLGVYPYIKGVFLVQSLSRGVDTIILQGAGSPGGILPLINKRWLVTVALTPKGSRGFSTSSSSLKPKNMSNLDNLLDSFPSLSGNLHLFITSPRYPNIKEGYQMLLKMYNSLTDPVVKLYIQNNCLYLMSLDKLTKGIIQRDFVDYKVDGQDKHGHPSLYTGKAGCYAFLCLKTGEYYVGSAICLYTRYKAHKVTSSRPEKGGSTSLYLSVRKHGWHNFI